MTNRERIEAYFDDQLSTTEKESLLRDIESDTALKAEFNFQNEVVEGIQAYRKQQLITRLNNVKVASFGSSALTKIIGAIGIAAIVSVGLFWYFNGAETSQEVSPITEIVDVPLKTEEPSAIKPTEEDPTKAEAANEDDAPNITKKTTKQNNEPVVKQEQEITPDVNVPEMVEPASEKVDELTDDNIAPESIKSEAIALNSSANVEIKLDKRYNFHYQIVNDDLTLYGDFNESTFEIIELKINSGIELFLYYNKNYFALKDDSDKIRPLEPVDNKLLIEKLDKRRQ